MGSRNQEASWRLNPRSESSFRSLLLALALNEGVGIGSTLRDAGKENKTPVPDRDHNAGRRKIARSPPSGLSLRLKAPP